MAPARLQRCVASAAHLLLQCRGTQRTSPRLSQLSGLRRPCMLCITACQNTSAGEQLSASAGLSEIFSEPGHSAIACAAKGPHC